MTPASPPPSLCHPDFFYPFQRSTKANGQTMTHCLASHSTPAKSKNNSRGLTNLCSIVVCPVFKNGSRTHPYSHIARVPVASRAAFGASAAGWPICCVWYWFSRSSAHSARTRKSHLVPSAWRYRALRMTLSRGDLEISLDLFLVFFTQFVSY